MNGNINTVNSSHSLKSKIINKEKKEEKNDIVLVGIGLLILFGLSQIGIGQIDNTQQITVEIIVNG